MACRRGRSWSATTSGTSRETILNAEVRRIARELARELEIEPDDAWRADIEAVLVELFAAFPVYRSYLPDGHEHLAAAAHAVRAERPDLGRPSTVAAAARGPGHAPSLRFQQTSGMVMAKGVEDRAFYRWSRLTSLNEVGADPDHFALAPRRLPCGDGAATADRTPSAMTTLSTHDTKRSEDVRARISVLAEDPDWWAETVDALLAAAPAPDPGFANLLWQAALGAWPI